MHHRLITVGQIPTIRSNSDLPGIMITTLFFALNDMNLHRLAKCCWDHLDASRNIPENLEVFECEATKA